jgi:hypothetical protein
VTRCCTSHTVFVQLLCGVACHRRTLTTMLSDFCTPDILDDSYRFSENVMYYAPANASLLAHQSYIRSLPMNDTPSLFGLHDNASVATALQDAHNITSTGLAVLPKMTPSASSSKPPTSTTAANALSSTLVTEADDDTNSGGFSRTSSSVRSNVGAGAVGGAGAGAGGDVQQQQTLRAAASSPTAADSGGGGGGGGGVGAGAALPTMAADILARLPERFDVEAVNEAFPPVYEQSMNTVLAQEVVRYNRLLDVVRGSLQGLLEAVQVCMCVLLLRVHVGALSPPMPALCVWTLDQY